MITLVFECDHCGQRVEKKFPWIRDVDAGDLKKFYDARGFSDDYLNMDVCPECREKFEDVTFRE